MRLLGISLLTANLFLQPTGASATLCYTGLNLSGPEYGGKDGIEGTNFIYPREKTVRYFADKGMNIVRLPFNWARLQPSLNSPLSGVELDRLKASVELMRSHGMTVLLDPHNFGYYDGGQIGSPDVPVFAFADFWTRLAAEFANQEDVLFGLMNEPYDIPAIDWLDAANAAIAGIRAVGARNLILVPGTRWSGASGWRADHPGGSNASVMVGVNDPLDNYAYEFHQYLDLDSSGTKGGCPAAAVAINAVLDVTEWLRQVGKKGFLGEFGGSQDEACLAGLKAMTQAMHDNPDAWLGWSYWAAGEWWPPTEINNIQPTPDGDRKQLSALVLVPRETNRSDACATMPAD